MCMHDLKNVATFPQLVPKIILNFSLSDDFSS